MLGFIGVILGVITLHGATGENLRARAYFDANNVKVGDPMILTIDFLGKADFASLHPPALSKAVDCKTWRLDDSSAKTQTAKKTVSNFFNSWEVPLARTITYRVRPMKEGVLWFPELEFEYETAEGERKTAKTSAIPVHAVPGEQVVVAEMGEDENALPQPDALVGATDEVRSANDGLKSDETWFRWRKACSHPTADAFAEFDFPAAKLNEARCAILDGNWARAMKIYSRLEWRTGQTPEIERGILAALAVKAQSREVELPVWRQVGRPVLRFAWAGRVGILVGGLIAVVLLFVLTGRIIRALACVAVPLAFSVSLALLSCSVSAQGLFNFNFSGFGGFGEMEQVKPAEVRVTAAADRKELQVGDVFKFVLALETSADVTLENLNLKLSETFGLQTVGKVEMRPATESPSNPSNVVRWLSVPVRYDVPFKGRLVFTVEGMQTRAIRRRNFSSTTSTSFSASSAPLAVEIRPLPTAGQPADFSGIVAQQVLLTETPDATLVNSNDVVTISCVMRCGGYVPPDYVLPGAAFEWQRTEGGIEWKKYFVADGTTEMPYSVICYYDPVTKTYKRATSAPRKIRYR